MGTRQLLKGEEIQKDGKSFLHLEFARRYDFDTFSDVDDHISSIIAWFNEIGLKKGDHVVIFAETRPEWMQTAIASFKYGLPVITVYATLGGMFLGNLNLRIVRFYNIWNFWYS